MTGRRSNRFCAGRPILSGPSGSPPRRHGTAGAPDAVVVISAASSAVAINVSRRQRTSWPRSRLSLMVAGHVPQGSARPSACWFSSSPCASRRRRGRRSFRRSSKTSWRASSRWSSSSSSRWCSSSCSGWCTSCRRRSRTSATTRSSRPSARCASCRWCSAGCCGRSRGCGRTRSRSCTRWPTARTSVDHDDGRELRATRRRRQRRCRTGLRASRSACPPPNSQALRADVDALEAKFARDEVR